MKQDKLKTNQDWRGYTIDELRYRKALTLLRIELQKERLSALKENLMLPQSSVVGKIGKGLFANSRKIGYAITAYKVFTALRGLYARFRRRK